MFCNSFLNWFTLKYLNKKWNIDKFIHKLLKSVSSLLNPPNNPGLRFSPDLAPYLNDVPYCPLPSGKTNWKDFLMTGFWKISKTLAFETWSHSIPELRFSKFRLCHLSFFIDTKFISEMTNELSLRHLRKDQQTQQRIDGHGLLLWTPLDKPWVQNKIPK